MDGNLANWQNNPVFRWVIEVADFFLFVQSSVAALNKDTKECFVREVASRGRKPPIWCIQNIIDARFWLPEAQRTEDAERQRDQALSRVKEMLDWPADKPAPASVGLNLGLAWGEHGAGAGG